MSCPKPSKKNMSLDLAAPSTASKKSLQAGDEKKGTWAAAHLVNGS